MGTVELSRSFANPEHVGGLAVVLTMVLPGECSLIRQNETLVWGEHLPHVLKQIVMSTYRVKVPLAQLTVLRLPVLDVQVVNVISFVVVNLLAIVSHELWSAGLGILTCNPAYYHCPFGAGWLDYWFALVEELHFIFMSINQILSKTWWWTC